MIKNIRTPGETEHKAYVSYMSDGIMDYDEAYAASVMKGIRRISTYNSVLCMIYGQYIHLIGSTVEYSMIKILEKNGHSLEKIDRKVVSNILKRHYNVEINEIPRAKNYNKLYALWNFLKHNSISSYKSIKEEYPKILVKKPFRNGEFAYGMLSLKKGLLWKL